MNVKLSNIINTQESYLKLIDQGFLPILTRYSLSKDAETVTSEIQRFNQFKDNLIEKYGERSKDGNSMSISPNSKNIPIFMKELNELGNADVELLTEKIPEELFLVESCSLTGRDFAVLRGVFLESKKEEKEKSEDKEVSGKE